MQIAVFKEFYCSNLFKQRKLVNRHKNISFLGIGIFKRIMQKHNLIDKNLHTECFNAFMYL